MLAVQPNARAIVDQRMVSLFFLQGEYVLMELLSTSTDRSPLNCPSSSTPHSTLSFGDRSVQSSKGPADAGGRSILYDWRERLRSGPSIACPKPETDPRMSAQPHLRRNHQAEAIPITYFDPFLNGHEPTEAETHPPSEDNTDFFHEILPETRAEHFHAVDYPLPASGSPLLITPVTQTSLYRNLLYLINVRKPTASLPSLMEYHRRYVTCQSTRSYNLLLDLSLRHRQYGITEHLFKTLRHQRVPLSTETHQLMVRYLVQENLWDSAWDYVRSLQEQKVLPRDKNGRPSIPFQIWLEFCRAPKKRRNHSRMIDPSTTPDEQFQILHDVRPASVPPLFATPPFPIFCLVDLMLRSGRQLAARSLTEAYFKALPQPMTKKSVLGCLRIIHAHVTRCTAKQGLPRFYEARRMLISLLKLHSSLKPNGKTLCILFKMLQKAKRCGTIAWMHFAKFKRDWGSQVENRRVLRHISRLALKEGRLDITKKIRNVETVSRFERQKFLREECLVNRLQRISKEQQLRRMPYRLIYPRNGKEARLWYRHRARICRRLGRKPGSLLMIGQHEPLRASLAS